MLGQISPDHLDGLAGCWTLRGPRGASSSPLLASRQVKVPFRRQPEPAARPDLIPERNVADATVPLVIQATLVEQEEIVDCETDS